VIIKASGSFHNSNEGKNFEIKVAV